MKKTLLLFTSLLFLGHSFKITAEESFEKGKIIVSAGYGYGFSNAYTKTYTNKTGFSFSTLGPIHGKFEYALSDKIGMGLSINYASYKLEWQDYGFYNSSLLYKTGLKRTSLSAILRMNIHFATSEKLDPYWGIGLGYRTGDYQFYSDDPSAINLSIPTLIPVGFETTIGLRYYFTPNIGVYTEVGIAKSVIQAGLSIKF